MRSGGVATQVQKETSSSADAEPSSAEDFDGKRCLVMVSVSFGCFFFSIEKQAVDIQADEISFNFTFYFLQ